MIKIYTQIKFSRELIHCKNELSFVWAQFIDLYKLGGDI